MFTAVLKSLRNVVIRPAKLRSPSVVNYRRFVILSKSPYSLCSSPVQITSCRAVSISPASQAAFPVIYRMTEKAVVKHVDGEDNFTFSFVYSANKASPGRQYNMRRTLEESSEHFIHRIQASVGKLLNKKKKKNEEEIKIDVKFYTDKGDLAVETLNAGEIVKTTGLKMDVNGTEYLVVVNPPLVEEAKISLPIMTGCLVNPTKLQQSFETETKYEWYTSKDTVSPLNAKKPKLESLNSYDWTLRSQEFFFRPEISDIGCSVRLDITPYNGETKGDTVTVVAESQVEAGPDLTATLARQAWTSEVTQFPVFRVMSYNILADLYADSDFSRTHLFPQCPRFAMDYQYRVRLILQEIINFHPDILCLQENDRKVFKHDLLPVLDKFGFLGEFNKKGGQVDEGLSMFFRKSKFHLLETRATVFNLVLDEPRFHHLMQRVNKVSGLKDNLLKRTTAVQLMALQMKNENGDLVVVGNTHLFFKPDADHIRLLQIDMCLTEIRIFREELMKKFPEKKVSVLLCGDFNSTPPFGVLQYCTEGTISSDHRDWSSRPGEEISGLSLKHPFNLDTAAGTPQYTNYTVGFKDCLDYIFYDKSNFSVEQVVPFPTNDELALNTALPNVSFPSDHISVVVDLKLLQE